MIVVFVGPSLARARARDALPAADVRAPARRGDIAAAADDGAHTIVLIDGYLIHDYPPSPMEIHDVLRRGVRVIGTASLGALRAVELKPYGMVGAGWVYRQYAEGGVDRDDEVVVACDRRDGHAVTVPLINIRYGLQNLYWRRQLAPDQAAEAFARVSALYLEDRTTQTIRDELAPLLGEPTVEALLSPTYDIKAQDAIQTLMHVEYAR